MPPKTETIVAPNGKGCAFLMEMGTGKTLTTIAVMGRAYLDSKINKVLVVCPTSIMNVWETELNTYADFPVCATVLTGSGAKRTQPLQNQGWPGLWVAIINYEATWRVIKDLIEWAPDMVVYDESQRIKTHNAAQSKACHKISDATPYRMILTGTPVQNSPADFFSQYRAIDKTVFGTSFVAFRNRYVMMGGYGNHQVVGYKNLSELTQKAHSIAFRCTKRRHWTSRNRFLSTGW